MTWTKANARPLLTEALFTTPPNARFSDTGNWSGAFGLVLVNVSVSVKTAVLKIPIGTSVPLVVTLVERAPTPPKVADALAAAVPTTELFAEQLVCTLTGTGELLIMGVLHPMTPTEKLAGKGAAWADRVATDSAAARATRNKDRMTLPP